MNLSGNDKGSGGKEGDSNLRREETPFSFIKKKVYKITEETKKLYEKKYHSFLHSCNLKIKPIILGNVQNLFIILSPDILAVWLFVL